MDKLELYGIDFNTSEIERFSIASGLSQQQIANGLAIMRARKLSDIAYEESNMNNYFNHTYFEVVEMITTSYEISKKLDERGVNINNLHFNLTFLKVAENDYNFLRD